MKTLEDQMSFYAAYHQDARNKATHFVGVPVIVFSLMIPLGWLRTDAGGFPLSAALVVTAILALYYLCSTCRSASRWAWCSRSCSGPPSRCRSRRAA